MPTDEQIILLPVRAQVLTARFHQHSGMGSLWALVDPEEKNAEEYVVRMAGTGHEIEPKWAAHYISTDFLGSYVFHFFGYWKGRNG
jgi:hypothetical protein